MTLRRQIQFWLISALIIFVLLWLLSGILLPFIAGLVVAYFLDPVADTLERWGFSRLWATSLIILIAVLAFLLVLLLLLPVLGHQLGVFAERLPGYIAALLSLFDTMAPDWLKQAVQNSGLKARANAADFAGEAAKWAISILGSLWNGGQALVNFASLLLVTPIIVFYMLFDWDKIVARVDSWLPRDHRGVIRELAADVDKVLAGFIRGQGSVCLVLAVFYSLTLTVAGLSFGLLIGLVAGLLSFIPYVGALIGGGLSIGVALVQFWPDYLPIVTIAGIFAIGQMVEGNFLTPKLVGGRVGLHPAWIMFALFAFGYLFGFVGVLLAVPLASVAGVLCRFGLRQYLASKLYLGSGGDAAADAEDKAAGP